MTGVDLAGLDQALNALQNVGVVQTWVRRPLGRRWSYHVQLPDDRTLTVNPNQAALWTMGATAATIHASEQPRLPDEEVDRVEVADVLDMLVRIGVLRRWNLDRDGDYELGLRHDNWLMPANRINAFLGGALAAVKSQDSGERPA